MIIVFHALTVRNVNNLMDAVHAQIVIIVLSVTTVKIVLIVKNVKTVLIVFTVMNRQIYAMINICLRISII